MYGVWSFGVGLVWSSCTSKVYSLKGSAFWNIVLIMLLLYSVKMKFCSKESRAYLFRVSGFFSKQKGGLGYLSDVGRSGWVERLLTFHFRHQINSWDYRIPFPGPAEPQQKIAHKSLRESKKGGLVLLIPKLLISELKSHPHNHGLHWHSLTWSHPNTASSHSSKKR